MQKDSDNTRPGLFQTTRWSEIVLAQASDTEKKKIVMDRLLERYWKPIYRFIRQQGHRHDEASDLTQGFIAEVVLNRDLFKRADQSKGRFRTFLLHALKCFLADDYRKRNAKFRCPAGQQVDLDLLEPGQLPCAFDQADPDKVFHYQWAVEIIERTIDQTRQYCIQTGRELYWTLFNERILKPIQTQSKPPALKTLCMSLKIASESQASNMVVTVKRTFRRFLMEHLGMDDNQPAEIDDEFNMLLASLES